MLKIDSLTRSVVGRVAWPAGAARLCPLNFPPTIRNPVPHVHTQHLDRRPPDAPIGTMRLNLPEPMRIAFEEAEAAASRGEVPVGAVVMDKAGHVLARAGNRTLERKDPTAHAELLAILNGAAPTAAMMFDRLRSRAWTMVRHGYYGRLR